MLAKLAAVATILTVRRTGGFVGRAVTGTLDLTGADPRAAEAAALLARVDLSTAPRGRPHPDMYTYVFEVSGLDSEVVTAAVPGGVVSRSVPEHLLTPDLRALADLVLSQER